MLYNLKHSTLAWNLCWLIRAVASGGTRPPISRLALRLLHTSYSLFLKCGPSLLGFHPSQFLAPLLLNPGDGPVTKKLLLANFFNALRWLAIGAHAGASVSLSFFLFDSWDCNLYWYIFGFCRWVNHELWATIASLTKLCFFTICFAVLFPPWPKLAWSSQWRCSNEVFNFTSATRRVETDFALSKRLQQFICGDGVYKVTIRHAHIIPTKTKRYILVMQLYCSATARFNSSSGLGWFSPVLSSEFGRSSQFFFDPAKQRW